MPCPVSSVHHALSYGLFGLSLVLAFVVGGLCGHRAAAQDFVETLQGMVTDEVGEGAA